MLYLASKYMVAKLYALDNLTDTSLNLAKIHMVAKQASKFS